MRITTQKNSKNKIVKGALSVIGLALLLVIFFIIKTGANFNESYIEYEKEPDENESREGAFHPNDLSTEELAEYKKWKQDLIESGFSFSTVIPRDFSLKAPRENSSPSLKSAPGSSNFYANGKITGSWQKKSFMDDVGHRISGSVYDPVNHEFFAVSSTGKLYKLNLMAENKWSIRNNKENFKGKDFTGVNLANGDFRLLQQSDNGAMRYSDDEGRTWSNANGALFENGWNHNTVVTDYEGGKRIVAHGSNYSDSSGYHRIFISTDYGLNYTQSSQAWARADYEVKVCKPHHSNSVYAFSFNKVNKKVSIYRMTSSQTDFSLVRTTTETFNSLSKLFGTYVNGNYHFYISAGAANIHYSDDEGASWVHKASDNKKSLQAVHPDHPNILFKGFQELLISNDYGVTWEKNNHKLSTYTAWDIRHMRMYEKANGNYFAFVGLDFGCYYSEDPVNWNSWQTINPGTPVLMCYDAIYSNKNKVQYAGMQDRGCRGYHEDYNATYEYYTAGVAFSDILRVALAKDESSLWFWIYTGQIGRTDVTPSGAKANRKTKDFYSHWWAAPMVGSPDQTEDAVYIASGTKLQKISYKGGKISRTYHSFEFPDDLGSFGYSKLNTNRWYACLKNGTFYYSTDGGNTFTQSSYTSEWPKQDDGHKRTQQVIKASPVDEATVYFAGKDEVFLISTDGGQTFTNHSNGLDIVRFRDFDISPDGKYIYGACAGAGPWVYSAADDQWYSMDGADVDKVDYMTVQYILFQDIIRFTSYGGGIVDFKLDSSDIWTKVDDRDASVSYDNEWSIYDGDGYMNTQTNSSTISSTATFSFTGNKVRYYGFLESNLGYADIYIDDVFQKTVDCYSSTKHVDTLLYESPELSMGPHTLKVVVNGSKNSSSSDIKVICDAFEYYDIVEPGSFTASKFLQMDNDIIVHPNPVSEILFIKNLDENISYKVYGLDGKIALQGKHTELDVSGLSSGLYFVKFSNGKTIKFIRE